ncbi:hypothetical protein FQN54_007625 [Arachnomyces sp. PD_36]|nr:hypothetical protein FQN54_007625 [Arachnomyces sp. PD_36]
MSKPTRTQSRSSFVNINAPVDSDSTTKVLGVLIDRYSRKKVDIGANSSTSTSATTAAADPEPEYMWTAQTTQKHVGCLATDIDESLYPADNQCQGPKSEKSRQIPRLLRELLNCNAGVSLPDDAENALRGQTSSY